MYMQRENRQNNKPKKSLPLKRSMGHNKRLGYVHRHKNILKTKYVAGKQSVQFYEIPKSKKQQCSARLQKLEPNFFSPIISHYFVVSSIYISHQARLGIPSWSTPRNLSLPNKKQKSHRAHLGITLIEHISEIREEFPKIVTVSTLNPCLPLVFHFLFL